MADPPRVRLGKPDLEPLAPAPWRDTHRPALRRARVRPFGSRRRRAVGGHLGGRSRGGGRRGRPRALRPARACRRAPRSRSHTLRVTHSASPASSSTAATRADAELRGQQDQEDGAALWLSVLHWILMIRRSAISLQHMPVPCRTAARSRWRWYYEPLGRRRCPCCDRSVQARRPRRRRRQRGRCESAHAAGRCTRASTPCRARAQEGRLLAKADPDALKPRAHPIRKPNPARRRARPEQFLSALRGFLGVQLPALVAPTAGELSAREIDGARARGLGSTHAARSRTAVHQRPTVQPHISTSTSSGADGKSARAGAAVAFVGRGRRRTLRR